MSETKRKVLVLTASLGAGHNQVARAIVESLQRQHPELDVTLLDVLTIMPTAMKWYYVGGFLLGMTRLPWLYGLFFRLFDHPNGRRRGLAEGFRLWTESRYMLSLVRYVQEHKPDLVVNSHFLPANTLGYWMKRGRLDVRQMVVITDIDVHRWWFADAVEHWFVAFEHSVRWLIGWGVDRGRVTVSGIPVHSKWLAPLDRARILADWKLPEGKKIVLLTGGTEFTCGPIEQIAQGILDACPQACVVVLAGRNKELLARLSLIAQGQPRLVPVSFTDRSQELVEVSSLMVTKPGGVTTTECLAKGTPMVLLKPVPGQEGNNARFLVANGAAVITRDEQDVIDHVRRLLECPEELAKMSAAARGLFHAGTPVVVDAVVRALGEEGKVVGHRS